VKLALLGTTGYTHTSQRAQAERITWERLRKVTNLAFPTPSFYWRYSSGRHRDH
jgi:hypothetical protein